MSDIIKNALQNLLENAASADEIKLLQGALSAGEIFIGSNVQNSVIIVGSENSVQLSPEAIECLTSVDYLSSLHQLPQSPADFVGRERELEKILKNIEHKGGGTICGLIGMACIGKTTLGLVVAHNLVKKYPDAQFFIDLQGISYDEPQKLDHRLR